MDEMLTRMWQDLVGRIHGPFSFRFVLQPLMALIYATRDGIVDARQHRPPYFWRVLFTPGSRTDLLHEGWKAVGRVIAIGALIDVVYQFMTFGRIYPFEAATIVLALAFVPYVILRGPVNRIGRAWMTRRVRT